MAQAALALGQNGKIQRPKGKGRGDPFSKANEL
jgi:hypothetical protein